MRSRWCFASQRERGSAWENDSRRLCCRVTQGASLSSRKWLLSSHSLSCALNKSCLSLPLASAWAKKARRRSHADDQITARQTSTMKRRIRFGGIFSAQTHADGVYCVMRCGLRTSRNAECRLFAHRHTPRCALVDKTGRGHISALAVSCFLVAFECPVLEIYFRDSTFLSFFVIYGSVEAGEIQTAACKRTEKLFPRAFISVIYFILYFLEGNNNYTVKVFLAFNKFCFENCREFCIHQYCLGEQKL